jgi:hypothetical protein
VVATSYRVSFGHDPVIHAGGGMLGSFEFVPATIYLDEEANMEVWHFSCFEYFLLCQHTFSA